MAGRTFMRSILLSEPWGRPCHRLSPLSSFSPFFSSRHRFNLTHFHSSSPLRCSNGEYPPPSSSSSSSSSFQQEGDQGPPQEAILKAISEVSKSEGRVAQTTNVIIGGTVTDDATNRWLQLDQKVNSYPMVRGFTAIGTGGDDFVHAMVDAVESVLQQPIPKGQVTQRLSSKGKYVSVNIGPICVVSSEQVQAVYSAMRRDDRMKYFL